MPKKKSAPAHKPKAVKRPSSTGANVFNAEERAAMRDRVQEVKAERAGQTTGQGGNALVLDKIGAMAEPDRALGRKLHDLIMASAPNLTPRLWYGMPSYARDGDVVCFFQPAQRFKTRYATLGFSDKAKLDDGNVWATGFAVRQLTAADEPRIAALIKKAVG